MWQERRTVVDVLVYKNIGFKWQLLLELFCIALSFPHLCLTASPSFYDSALTVPYLLLDRAMRKLAPEVGSVLHAAKNR